MNTLAQLLRTMLLLSIIATPFATANAYDAQCTGNACGDTLWAYVNGCHTVKNIGTRTVRIVMGNLTYTLAPGASGRYAPFGSCVQFYPGGNNKANYV